MAPFARVRAIYRPTTRVFILVWDRHRTRILKYTGPAEERRPSPPSQPTVNSISGSDKPLTSSAVRFRQVFAPRGSLRKVNTRVNCDAVVGIRTFGIPLAFTY